MFDLIIKLDSEDLKLGVDGYSQGNMTIKGEHGSTRSEYTMMIFISLCELLHNIERIMNNGINRYQFIGIEGGFSFHIIKKDNTFLLTDYEGRLISKSSANEFVKSIWKGVDNFYSSCRPLVKEVDSGIASMDFTLKEFKAQFSSIINFYKQLSNT